MVRSLRRRKVSNPLGLAVLALLFERPMHPYEMAATLRERAKEQSIKLNYGSLYTVIKALLRAGFIAVRETVRAGARPERTIYGLSPSGRAELRDWLRSLLQVPVKEYTQFEAALSLMPVLPPGEATALLKDRLARLDRDAEAVRRAVEAASRQGVERLFLIEAEYLLAVRQAERDFVERLLGLIQRSPAFTRTWVDWHAKRRGRSRTTS